MIGVRTVELYPSKDSYSWQSVPDANNGKSDNFEITSYVGHNMRGWIEFSTSKIPTDGWIVSARLRLRLWQRTVDSPPYGDASGRRYGVYRITQPWGEMTVNWANQPAYTEDHHATAQVPAEQGGWFGPVVWMDWDVTDLMKDWQHGVPNYGLLVRDTQEDEPTRLYSTQFFSHDQVPNEGYFPRLIITYLNPNVLYAFIILMALELTLCAVLVKKFQRARN